jgi:hypothetical protein
MIDDERAKKQHHIDPIRSVTASDAAMSAASSKALLACETAPSVGSRFLVRPAPGSASAMDAGDVPMVRPAIVALPESSGACVRVCVCCAVDQHLSSHPSADFFRGYFAASASVATVLARARAFLPQMQVANAELQRTMLAGGQTHVNIEAVDEQRPHIAMDLHLGVFDVQPVGVATAAQLPNVAANTQRYFDSLFQRGHTTTSSSSSSSSSAAAASAAAGSVTSGAMSVDSDIAADPPTVVLRSGAEGIRKYDFEPLPLPPSFAGGSASSSGQRTVTDPSSRVGLVAELGGNSGGAVAMAAESADALDAAEARMGGSDSSSSSSSSSDEDENEDDDDGDGDGDDGIDLALLPPAVRERLLQSLLYQMPPPPTD